MKKIRRAFVNYEAEEIWLNKMSDIGLQLVHYNFLTYTFEMGEPGEYSYRIELLNDMPKSAESKKYIDFIESAGVECIATWFRWVYFRKKRSEGVFDLYSDYESKIAHYKRIMKLWYFFGAFNLFAGSYNLLIWGTLEHSMIANLLVGMLGIAVGSLLLYYAVGLRKRTKKLMKEKVLSEY